MLFAIGAVALAFVLFTGKSDGNVSCYATSGGVAVVAEGLRKQETAGAIVAAAGAGFLASKCDDWVKALVDDPTKSTDLKVKAPGSPVDTTVSGQELAERPAQPSSDAGGSLSRLLACFRWQSSVLFDWCADGLIDPPASTPTF